ncbi:MAG: hypothetical protein BGO31_05500 [Bacteroidetes bacterium 43-16]|uniref:hypothetical protein n=1 Tax=uncultured Dysgonomonas sp. TaxID=206096 RepID=UPI00092C458C|nr:hypothetical protein [uncultured Dysgonomonas sp.]OJV52286.1 MAG: hypothetical protein BGO31_05500 [Bacteroidetes bacterium 43-16]
MENGWDIEERTPTFFSALDEWDHFEELSRERFGKDSLKDRDFKKLKLREFDRLYYYYNRRSDLSRDEKAMLLVLDFQRTKLTKALFPGLIRRLLYKTASTFRLKIIGVKDPFATDADRYVAQSLYRRDTTTEQITGNEIGREQRTTHRVPRNMRSAKRNRNGRSQSM